MATPNLSDPFVKLPAEVIQNVCQHLELYELFSAQRVSKIWQTQLSLQNIENSLRAWFDDRSPRSSENLSMQVLNQEAETVDAFQNGKATSMAIGKWGNKSVTKREDMIAFDKGCLAWITKGRKQVFIKYLNTGKDRRHMMRGQAKAQRITINGTSLAIANDEGTCKILNNIDVFEQYKGLHS